jgi:hypothetical protein
MRYVFLRPSNCMQMTPASPSSMRVMLEMPWLLRRRPTLHAASGLNFRALKPDYRNPAHGSIRRRRQQS